MAPKTAPPPRTAQAASKDQPMDHSAHPASSPPHSNQPRSRRMHPANNTFSFTRPPRPHHPTSLPRRSARRAHAHNTKEHVNAQYRFILKPTGDYTAHFADPDIYFDWKDILQVIVPTSTVLERKVSGISNTTSTSFEITCPICLCMPSAPRMTPCGHVFCYPCVLHYLELGQGTKWRKCPVCGDPIHYKDVKSVKWFDACEVAKQVQVINPPPKPPPTEDPRDKWITMRLLARPDFTTLALPQSPTWPHAAEEMENATPWHFTPDAFAFSKFMLSTSEHILQELERDELELSREARSNLQDEAALSFINRAMVKVLEQKEKAKLLDTPWVKDARENAQKYLDRVIRLTEKNSNKSGSTNEDEINDANKDVLTQQQRHSHQPQIKQQPSSTYYFYQAASGQPIFLHSLDIRLLKAQFERYSDFPETIRVRIRGTDEAAVDAEFRRKNRYLGHLPEACDVTFVEADLSDIVDANIIKQFETQLKQRANRRRERNRRENRARNKAEASESLFGQTRTGITSLSSGDNYSPSLVELLETVPETGPGSSMAASSWENVERTGHRTVWGTPEVARSSEQRREEEDKHDDGYLNDDAQQNQYWSIEDALTKRQRDNLSTAATTTTNGSTGNSGRKHGKGKKNNNRVVISLTGGGFSRN